MSGDLRVRLSGAWILDADVPVGQELIPQIQALPRGSRLVLEDAGITEWDSFLVAFVRTVSPRRRGTTA